MCDVKKEIFVTLNIKAYIFFLQFPPQLVYSDNQKCRFSLMESHNVL